MYQVLQEAIDELEYCTGDVNTTYGALRATHGHPEPFQIKYENIFPGSAGRLIMRQLR